MVGTVVHLTLQIHILDNVLGRGAGGEDVLCTTTTNIMVCVLALHNPLKILQVDVNILCLLQTSLPHQINSHPQCYEGKTSFHICTNNTEDCKTTPPFCRLLPTSTVWIFMLYWTHCCCDYKGINYRKSNFAVRRIVKRITWEDHVPELCYSFHRCY